MKIKRKLRKKLVALLPQFQQLRENLRKSQSEQPLTGIVHFFHEVSQWHDRGIGDLIMASKKNDLATEELKTLQFHFINAGRCKHGMNRTEPGQSVSFGNVFLGGIYGLFTKPISFWLQKEDDPKGGWGFPGMDHLNPYDVVSQQAREFMDSHVGPMTNIIDNLEAAL